MILTNAYHSHSVLQDLLAYVVSAGRYIRSEQTLRRTGFLALRPSATGGGICEIDVKFSTTCVLTSR